MSEEHTQTVLVTGGAGYIGSHTCVELLNKNYQVIVIDSLINSSLESLNRVQEITSKTLTFYQGSIANQKLLEKIFSSHQIEVVIHFAGLKAVSESVMNSLEYYNNNVVGGITLLKVMSAFNVKKLVFSSSATVYGNPIKSPITEDSPLQPTNPYGRTKLFLEEVMKDLTVSDKEWKISILRYFNPVGAHPSGRIGEHPKGSPNNLFPYLTQVAIGKLDQLSIYGTDYDTHDGTGSRDYLHVTDLALGHIAAMKNLLKQEPPYCGIHNLGRGKSYTVFEVLKAMEKAVGKNISYQIKERRNGDVDALIADTKKANQQLNWSASIDLEKMCVDSWNWQSKNPNGYSQSSLVIPNGSGSNQKIE